MAPSVFMPELPSQDALPPWVFALAERHLRTWEQGDLQALSLDHVANPEWNFMGRTFVVLGLANLSLRAPAFIGRAQRVMDRIIEDTLRVERQRGFAYFLMAYGQQGGWQSTSKRSVFVDGEIALMLAARQLVGGVHGWPNTHRGELQHRLEQVASQMREGPILSAESYPNECWTFCNTAALAALKLGEACGLYVDPTLGADWLVEARRHLVDPESNLLISSYQLTGTSLDRVEGSSIWMSAHNLSVVDPIMARDQYERAKRSLMRTFVGFGYAREWPAGAPMGPDVDSGPIVPILQASASSSGLAVLAASTFGDLDMFGRLCASLKVAAFPEERDGTLRYLASNYVGDSVLFYAGTVGPLWELS